MDDVVELVADAHTRLGEGPVWDGREGLLVWVDILHGRVLTYDPIRTTMCSHDVGQHIGAIVPREAGGYALAVEGGFALLDHLGGSVEIIAPVEEGNTANRMNDGKVDPSGRFWAGTMAYEETIGAGSLYRLDVDRTVHSMLQEVTVSNGLGWATDRRTMYYIDTGAGGVDAFDYDDATGEIGNRRRIVDIPPENGYPDGMTIDEEGYLWVGLWMGWGLHRYAPDGTLDRVVKLPVSLVTSCAFGGPDLADLYISCASELTESELTGQPSAGGLFRYRPGVKGTPPKAYRG